MNDLTNIIGQKFPDKKIVIIGDLVADQFLHGTISRVSREAPVLILRHDETETLAGGAANAATNIASLRATAVLVGIVGKDPVGNELLKKLQSANVNCDYVIAADNFSTTTKVRVLAGQHYAPRQQVIRIDYENKTPVGAEIIEKLKTSLVKAAENADAIIVSDYNYGAATPEIAEIVRQIAENQQIPWLVDSRFRLREFSYATSATPNQEEVEQILGKNFSVQDCLKLCETLNYQSLLITRGNAGMLLIEKGQSPLSIEAVGSKEPIDVTGAGDTVIAVYALGLVCGLSFAESARLANHAGSIVVMKKGTAVPTPEELLRSLTRHENLEQKAQTL